MSNLFIYGCSHSAHNHLEDYVNKITDTPQDYSNPWFPTDIDVDNPGVAASWYNRIYNELNFNKFKCYAMSGTSNNLILQQILATANEWESRDTIIIQRTDGLRQLNSATLLNKTNPRKLKEYKDRFNHQLITIHTQEIQTMVKRSGDSLNSANCFLDYHEEFIIPFKKDFDLYWNNIFLDLIRTLNKANPHTKIYYWVDGIRDKFETIWEASKGEYPDGHWSPKGNRDFADYAIDCMKNNKMYF